MQIGRFVVRGLTQAAMLVVCSLPATCGAEAFRLGQGQGFNFNQSAPATITEGQFSMTMAPATPGALLSQIASAGMGINSQPVVGADDPVSTVFNLIGGSGPLAGSGEALVFSFDRPGIITGMKFDGLKDELLEYFLLELSNGFALHFFDSSANMPDVPNPNYANPLDAALAEGALLGAYLLLWEEQEYDDDIHGLNIPFVAGQEFRLTFGAVDAPYSRAASNGARFEGIVVAAIPEPARCLLVGSGAFVLAARRRRELT